MHGTRREFIVSGGVILGSFVAAGLLTAWLAGQLGRHAENIVALRQETRQRARSLEVLAELRQIAPRLGVYEQRLRRSLPPQDNLLGFTRTLVSTGRSLGLDVRATLGGDMAAPTDESVGRVSFAASIDGERGAIGDFVRGLERLPSDFPLTIGSFTLSERGESYHAEISGVAFFRS